MALVYNLDHISDKQKKTNIRKAIGILEKAFYNKNEVKSFFLDPFEQKVIKDIAFKNNIDICFLGGNPKSERKIFVANYYYLPLYAPNYISVLEFDALDIRHPDVLGSLISLGIDRNNIGDISIFDDKAEFVTTVEESDFIEFNFSKIRNESITIRKKIDSILDINEEIYERKAGFITSLRLDNLIAELVSTSRSKAKTLIESRMVKVDFQIIEDPAYKIHENSLISIRHYGRYIFDEIDGVSKKDKFHILYRKIL